MKNAPKRMHPQTVSHALLAALPATFDAPVTVWPKSRRFLQIRANVLLIFRRQSDDVSAADRTVRLTAALAVRRLSATVVQLDKVRYNFQSERCAAAFVAAVDAARQPAQHKYDVVGRIGNGASGVVYLVERREDGKKLAMKTVPKYDVFYSDSHLEHIIAERTALAEAAASEFPFIVRLVDAFETDTHLCFVTELASFGDLHSLVASSQDRRIPEEVARRLFAEALLGLEDLHRLGYLYRDMKLGNLLLSATGHVRLADFGLAKKLKVESFTSDISTLTSDSEGDEEEFRLVGRTKSFVGTRRYMSPEHLVSGHGSKRGYGAPADVWALGVVLYIMLTGRYPFGDGVSSGNSAGLFMAIKNDDLTFPSWVSAEARDLLKGMLDRDWLERKDIAAIKAHPWLRSVKWGVLREQGLADEPVAEVVELALANGQPIEKKYEGMKSSEVMSDVSTEEGSGKRRGRVGENIELLGFGYMG